MIRLWPYAYGATIRHEFDTDHLNVWLTFRYPMDQSNKPAHGLWVLTVDDVEKAISSSAWQDEFTLLLESDAVIAYPNRVLLTYVGPSYALQTTWGKDWEPWEEILSADVGKGVCFVDRGDPATVDFGIGDFIRNGFWHFKNLSGIVPDYARSVAILMIIRATVANHYFMMRRNVNANAANTTQIRTQVANIYYGSDCVVPLDDNRIIEYRAAENSWTVINMVVKGWWF